MALPTATPAPAALHDYLARLNLKAEKTPVFLNFFRSDCPWCTTEMPRLVEIYKLHKDLRVHIIGVAEHATEEAALAYARGLGWNFPIITDADETLKNAFGVRRVPSIVVIDCHGQLVRFYEGVTEQLTGILEQTVFAVAHDTEPPHYDMIGNGCEP